MHGMWTGTLSFGLVSVPVSLFPAMRSRPTHLRMMSAKGEPLHQLYKCSKDGKPLDRDDLVRGYKAGKGKLIVVKDEELKALAPDKVQDISLREFVRLSDIPDFYFDRPYYLAPSGGSSKAYQLLAHVMEKRQRVGIGIFVMRDKEYLVAIIAEHGILMAETLRFADEVRDTSQISLPERHEVKPAVRRKIKTAVSAASRKTFSVKELEDHYAERLQRLIEKKRKAGVATVHRKPEEEEAEPGKVIDLVTVFKERMRQAAEGGKVRRKKSA
jgi:DNA end-binding protein Ku